MTAAAITLTSAAGLWANSDTGIWQWFSPHPDTYWQNVFTCIFTAALLIPLSILLAPLIGRAIRAETVETVTAVLNAQRFAMTPFLGTLATRGHRRFSGVARSLR